MTNAKITIPGGISVEVSGTPEEVISVVENLKSKCAPQKGASVLGGKSRGEISNLVESLKTEDFFKEPRGLGEIRKKLAELGHHYPITTLSGSMQEQTKRRNLRRFKQGGKYVYVQ